MNSFQRVYYIRPKIKRAKVNPRTTGGGVQIFTPYIFSNIFATRANFKMRSNQIPRGSNSGYSGFPHVSVALSSTWSDLENQGHPPWKNQSFLLVDVTSVSSDIQT